MRLISALFLPTICLSQFFHLYSTEKELEEYLALGLGKHYEEQGVIKCLRKERKSPININIANTTLTSFPPLVMKDYSGYETVTEVEDNNSSATISGYEKWKNRPTLSGGPLNGSYQLVEVHWDVAAVALIHSLFHYGHTINSARYNLELHFVHTLNGTAIEEAKKRPNGVVIVSTFVNEVAMTKRDMEFFHKNYTESSVKMIPNETGTPFEWVPPSFFFPEEKDVYFTYNGTFAHPPCEGDVTWILMATPISMCRLEMTRYLHAAAEPKASLNVLSATLKMVRDHNAEIFFNFPKKQQPEAEPLVAENTWHGEIISGFVLAGIAAVLGVTLTAYAYKHYGKKDPNVDANFRVGFDNINFLNQSS